MKKYELTNETKTLAGGTVLHRIRALRDIPRSGVKAGELGGFVEGENNLSQDGDAWIFCNANVYGNAEVYDNSKVSGDTWIFGNAKVYGDAEVYGKAWVFCDAWVFGNAKVSGKAWVYGNARVFGDAKIYGDAEVSSNAKVYGKAEVYGDAEVFGNAEVSGDANVENGHDYFVAKNTWSSLRWFTYTSSNKKWAVGCFYGTGEELIKKAYADSELSGRCYEAIVRAVETIEAAKSEAKGESNGSK